MKNILIGSIIFFAVVLQASFFSNIFPGRIAPDIALLVIVIWTIKYDFHIVLKWAIFGGFLVDLFSFQIVGINIIAFVSVAFITNSLGKRFLVAHSGWKFLIFFVMIVSATLLGGSIVFLAHMAFSGAGGILLFSIISDYAAFIFSKEVLWKIAYNFLMFLLMLRPLGKIDRIIDYYSKKTIIK